MRILADESLPAPTIVVLRAAGHDVVSVWETMRGALDTAVIEHASRDDRVLVTLDKDFGDLVFNQRHSGEPGVVLVRARTSGPAALGALLLSAFAVQGDWRGAFGVVEDDRVRVTPIPAR